MIQYLRKSSFAVHEVIGKSWILLRTHYFSIAGLCFLLFLISNASAILASFFNEIHWTLSVFMAFFFITVYAGLQLMLFKYIFHLIDENAEASSGVHLFPDWKEIVYFFCGMLFIGVMVFSGFVLLAVLIFPLIYLFKSTALAVDLFAYLSVIFMMAFLLRVAFYPFFIIDRHEKPVKSIRLSFAITRGNFIKLLLLLFFFAILHLLTIYFNFKGSMLISAGIALLNSFIVIPLSSVCIGVAYRKMMVEYKGEQDPGFMQHIL